MNIVQVKPIENVKLNVNPEGKLTSQENYNKIIAADEVIKVLDQQQRMRFWNYYKSREREVKTASYVSATAGASTLFDSLKTYRKGMKYGYSMDQIVKFFNYLDDFPFYEELKQTFSINASIDIDPCYQIIDQILDVEGLNYEGIPLGLIRVGKYQIAKRTVIHEQLMEAFHFQNNEELSFYLSVQQQHAETFQQNLEQVKTEIEQAYQQKCRIEYLSRSTNDGQIKVDCSWFSCLSDLNDIDADIIAIKPVNNLIGEFTLKTTINYKKILGGYLLYIQDKIFDCLKILLEVDVLENDQLCHIISFVEDELNITIPEKLYADRRQLIQFLKKILNRPIRICGVVHEADHLQCGAFKVKNDDGLIQPGFRNTQDIDSNDADQHRIYQSSSYQNAFEMLITTKNHEGKTFDLTQFTGDIDPIGHIHDSEINAISNLMTVGMNDWTTIIVALPKKIFNQINNINDILSKH